MYMYVHVYVYCACTHIHIHVCTFTYPLSPIVNYKSPVYVLVVEQLINTDL